MENYTGIAPSDKADAILPEDDTEELEAEYMRREKEGGFEDIGSFQGIVCLIAVIGLVVLNISQPELAEGLFTMFRRLAESKQEIMGNPLDHVAEFVKNLNNA